MLALQSRFIGRFLQIFDLVFLFIRRFPRYAMLEHINDQLVEFAKTGVFVGLSLSTLICLKNETRGFLGVVSRGKDPFVQSGGK